MNNNLDEVAKERKVLLLTSYCGDNYNNCNNDYPCIDCLLMCNVANIKEDSIIKVLGGLDYLSGNKYSTKQSSQPTVTEDEGWVSIEDALNFSEYSRNNFDFYDSTSDGDVYKWVDFTKINEPAMTINQMFKLWKSLPQPPKTIK